MYTFKDTVSLYVFTFIVKYIFSGCLRSLGSIRKNAYNYVATRTTYSNGKFSSAAPFKSCIAVPLIEYEDATLVIDFIPPMELHIILGIVNGLYDKLNKALVASGSPVRAKDWSDSLHLVRRHYHGGQFMGNHCSTLLDNVDALEKILLDTESYMGIPYVDTFRKFKTVKDKCFGLNLIEGYKVALHQFKISYLKLGIPVTLKVHIVFEHVLQFCEKYGNGLGLYSEHSLESTHYDYKPFWEKSYKLAMTHPNYGEKLLNSLYMYNALHI